MSLPSEKVPPSVRYLRSLPSIRERCGKIFDLAASSNGLEYFNYDASKEDDVVDFCIDIIKRDFGDNYAKIPPHGRWRHFDVGGLPRITTLLSKWAGVMPGSASNTSASAELKPVSAMEAARRLVDLFIVSVLLDAGAGTQWKYEEKKTGLTFARSEGLAVASLDMFLDSRFYLESEKQPQSTTESLQEIGAREKVNARGLLNLSSEILAIDMQVHPQDNPMTGVDGRCNLLIRLGEAIKNDDNGFFVGPNQSSETEQDRLNRRPGNLVDYLATHPTTKVNSEGKVQVSVATLWEVLIYGLSPIWPPSRTVWEGIAMGDVWPCPHSLSSTPDSSDSLVPFHKLTQWMCYSIMEPIEQTLGWQFIQGDHQTGLPEYRNGGLFIDFQVLQFKPLICSNSIPKLEPCHPAVIEWRAMTVILLDRMALAIRTKLGLSKHQLGLSQVLEAATWKGGRIIALKKRSETGGGPPIEIVSDGTLF